MVVKEKAKYKETEIGIIPEDWEVESLGTLARIYRGASPRPIDSPIWFDENSNVGWVRISDVSKSSKYLLATTQKLSEAGIKNSRFIDENNLIMSICATVGRPIITQMKVCIHDGFVVFENSKIDKEYLYYYLMFIEDEWFKYGQIGSQMNLNTTIIQNQQICYPTLSTEQTSVIEALNDIDQLINSLEKLLIKKRSIKQGAMQELLSGKKRLPGFKNAWRIKDLGEIAEIRDGTHQTPYYVESGVPFYSVENVTNNDFRNTKYISEEEHKVLTKNFEIEKGDILMTRIGSIGECKLIDWNVRASFYVSLALLKITDSVSSAFIYHYSLSDYFKKQADAKSLQYATPKKINLGEIAGIKVFLPFDIEEQVAIAQVLSDMDSEIDALETKLTKYQQIKQGMMENLLTGRVRLV